MTGNQVDIGAWLKEAFELYKRHFGILVVANLIALALGAVTLGILAGPLFVGVASVTLALLDNAASPPKASDVFNGMKVFVPALLWMLLVALATVAVVGICQLTCILAPASPLGALLIGTATFFSPFFIWERRVGVWPAITMSYQAIKPAFWLVLAYALIAQFAAGLGAIACGIGAVFTAPFYMCAAAVAYRKMIVPLPPVAGEPLVKVDPPHPSAAGPAA